MRIASEQAYNFVIHARRAEQVTLWLHGERDFAFPWRDEAVFRCQFDVTERKAGATADRHSVRQRTMIHFNIRLGALMLVTITYLGTVHGVRRWFFRRFHLD